MWDALKSLQAVSSTHHGNQVVLQTNEWYHTTHDIGYMMVAIFDFGLLLPCMLLRQQDML